MSLHPAPNVVVAERFRLNRLLGRGGMGSVWHATHLGLDVPCAVKFIEGEGAHLPEVQSRFEREAKAAAQLRSPHVVQILDHGLCQGTPYIAMELLDGEDLGRRLARVRRMPPPEVLRIVVQVCRALTKAHAVGIVHRDLKPDNIFLVRDDDREIAKVLDFGIAKATGLTAMGSSTRTGAMLGTPYYMSPEQAQGIKAVDARSDLWSLAVIVFEALTGQRPFESEALGDLLMKIIVAKIPMPSELASDLPTKLDVWWERASRRDPAQRFQTARELCDALTAVFGRVASDVGETTPPPMGTPMLQQALAERSAPGLPGGTSTAAPMAHTFGARPPGVKNQAVLAAAVGGGLVLLTAGAIGVALAVRGGGAASSPPSSVASAAMHAAAFDGMKDAMAAEPAASVTAIAAPPRETIAPPPVFNDVPPAPSKAAQAAKPGPMMGSSPAPRSGSGAKASPGGAASPAPPAPAEKKKTIDLGI